MLKWITVSIAPYYTMYPDRQTYQARVTVNTSGSEHTSAILLFDDDFASSRFEQMMQEVTREVLKQLRPTVEGA